MNDVWNIVIDIIRRFMCLSILILYAGGGVVSDLRVNLTRQKTSSAYENDTVTEIKLRTGRGHRGHCPGI